MLVLLHIAINKMYYICEIKVFKTLIRCIAALARIGPKGLRDSKTLLSFHLRWKLALWLASLLALMSVSVTVTERYRHIHSVSVSSSSNADNFANPGSGPNKEYQQ